MKITSLKQLVHKLENKSLYDHPVNKFEIIETHASFILLTGSYAYKFKKKIYLEFLDFSTLEKRYFYCQEELRLNKHYSPNLYIAVVKITEKNGELSINGKGEIIEYAVKMRQFSQNEIFLNLLSSNKLANTMIVDLAYDIAKLHQTAVIASNEMRFGNPDNIFAPVQQNFDQIRPLLKDYFLIEQLNKLELWAKRTYLQLKNTIADRKEKGFIRECHGDLHLGNIVLFEGKPTLFDCVEFNEDFRWIDLIADVSFLTMDLDAHQQPKLINDFINAYLTKTGDYFGLLLHKFYQSYRAVIRGKVTLFRLQQSNLEHNKKQSLLEEYNMNMQLAEKYMENHQPQLFITHGISGSGKTTYAKKLAREINAIHLRSDIERKRLFDKDLYSKEATEKTYQKLLEFTKKIITAGYSVIIDATFLKKQYRDEFKLYAEEKGIPFTILSCQVDEITRREWLEQRQRSASDSSDADYNIAQEQHTQLESLSHDELMITKKITFAKKS